MIDRDLYRKGLEDLIKQLQEENDNLIRELREAKRQLELERHKNFKEAAVNVE